MTYNKKSLCTAHNNNLEYTTGIWSYA